MLIYSKLAKLHFLCDVSPGKLVTEMVWRLRKGPWLDLMVTDLRVPNTVRFLRLLSTAEAPGEEAGWTPVPASASLMKKPEVASSK